MTGTEFLHRQIVRIALFASLLAFAIRGFHYAMLGSYVPIWFLAGVVGFLGLGWIAGMTAFKWAARIWGVVLCIYAIARLCVSIIVLVDPSLSAHATDSFTAAHALLSALYLLGGLYLIKQAHNIRR